MTRRALAIAVALLAVLPACDGDGGGDRSAADGSSATAEGGPVELLDAGAEPRSPMRLDLTPGETHAQRIAVDLDMEITSAGHTQAVDSPRTIMDMDMEVLDHRDGVFTLRSTMSGSDVEPGEADPAVVEQTRQVLQTMVGTTYQQRLDERGVSHGSDALDVPADVPAEARSMMEQMTTQVDSLAVPFPADPVGVGARWARSTDATLNGIPFSMRFEYHLVERDGDDYAVDVSYEQSIVPGPMELPGVPGTAVADGGTTNGAGQLRGSLRRLVATGTIRASGDIAMHLGEGDDRTDLSQTLTMVMETTPR